MRAEALAKLYVTPDLVGGAQCSLYELPRGLDQRLSGDSTAMPLNIRQNQAHYLQRAHQALDRMGT